MLLQLSQAYHYGFNPPYESSIVEAYKSSGNNRLSKVFQGAFDESVGKMVSERVLRPWTEGYDWIDDVFLLFVLDGSRQFARAAKRLGSHGKKTRFSRKCVCAFL